MRKIPIKLGSDTNSYWSIPLFNSCKHGTNKMQTCKHNFIKMLSSDCGKLRNIWLRNDSIFTFSTIPKAWSNPCPESMAIVMRQWHSKCLRISLIDDNSMVLEISILGLVNGKCDN